MILNPPFLRSRVYSDQYGKPCCISDNCDDHYDIRIDSLWLLIVVWTNDVRYYQLVVLVVMILMADCPMMTVTWCTYAATVSQAPVWLQTDWPGLACPLTYEVLLYRFILLPLTLMYDETAARRRAPYRDAFDGCIAILFVLWSFFSWWYTCQCVWHCVLFIIDMIWLLLTDMIYFIYQWHYSPDALLICCSPWRFTDLVTVLVLF